MRRANADSRPLTGPCSSISPDVAREELREAGVQIANASAARRAKVDAQIDSTKKTEPKGSTDRPAVEARR